MKDFVCDYISNLNILDYMVDTNTI